MQSNRKSLMKKMAKSRISQQLEKIFKADYKILKKDYIKQKPSDCLYLHNSNLKCRQREGTKKCLRRKKWCCKTS